MTPSSSDLERNREEARVLLGLLIGPSDWVFRRVESIVFIDDQLIRRRMSIDFQVPGYVVEEARNVVPRLPLAFLKKQPLVAFDLEDESGTSIPLLTKDQNSLLSWSVLMVLAEEILSEGPDDVLAAAFFQVASETGEPARAARDIFKRVEGRAAAQKAALSENDFFMNLLSTLVENFPLLAVPNEDWTARRVLKYSYIQVLDWDTPTFPNRQTASLGNAIAAVDFATEMLPVRLGWTDWDFDFSLPEIGLGGSYHFEVSAPTGLEIPRAIIWGGVDEHKKLNFSEYPLAVAHVYTSAQEPGASGRVAFDLRPRLQGLLRTSLLSSALTTALLVAGALHPEVLEGKGDLGATILLAAVGLVSTLLSRPGENSLVSRMFFGIRLMVGLAGLAAYGGALSLAVGRPDLWVQLASLSGLTTGSLLLAAINSRLITTQE